MDLNEIIGYLLGYGIPIGAGLVALLMVVVAMGVALAWTRYLVLALVFIVLLVPQASSYGMLDGGNAAVSIFWTKGTKSFFFSFLEMAIFGTWLLGVVIASRLSKKREDYSSPLTKWYMAFGLLFLGYFVIAMFGKSPLILEFGNIGVINVLKQGMFISLLFVAVRNERDLKVLIWIILSCLAAREAWGLLRYFFLGGDPQNIYANTYVELSGLKLTFFDINDHILASLMLGFTAWKILVDKLSGWEKVGYAVLTAMALLIPVLSVRRTAQGGMLLAMLVLFFLLPRGRKVPVLLIIAIILPLTVASLSLRTVDSSRSITEKILIDVKDKDTVSDPRKTRFYELETAWQTVKEEPFFGVGPSGSFKVTSPIGLEYHKGNYGFVHSGLGHVLLKTGFVGLFIFLSIFFTFIIHVKRGWELILSEHKALAVGALCGFAAQMPNMFAGAPVIEIRTMLVSGLLFALPLICISIARRKVVISQDGGFQNTKNPSYFSPTIPLAKLGKS